MKGKRFSDSEEALFTFNKIIEGIPPEEWGHSFDKWFRRMQSCIDAKGEYFEKL